MKKNSIFAVLAVGFLALGMSGSASAKSMYVIGSINTSPTPIRAYDINPTTGLVTYQTQHSVTKYSGGGVDVSIDSDSGILFVVYEASTTINIIDAKTMKSLGTTKMPGSAYSSGIVYDHKRKRLYVAYRGAGRVYSFSWNATTKKLTNIGTYTLSGLTRTFGLDLDENKGLLYVGGYTSTIRYYDVDNKFVYKGAISPPSGMTRVIGVAVDATRRYLYAGGYYNSYLCQFNLDTGKQIKCLTGTTIRGLSVDGDSGYLYVSTTTGRGIRVYDSNLVLKQTVNSIGNPTGLVVPGKDISYNPLNLTKSDGLDDTKDCVRAGKNATYTITYENKNSFQVTNAIITDTLPSSMTFVSATGGGTHSGGTITWKLGTIAASAKGSVTLVVTIKSTTAPGTALKNSGVIDSDQTPPTSQGDTTNVCKLFCGDGSVDGAELCDTAIISGTGKCPTVTDCDDKNVCTADSVTGSLCNVKCQSLAITANMTNKDGCCPTSATSLTDLDCLPFCGNSAVEAGEKCDTAITSGTGKCPSLAECNDLDVCTVDSLKGSSCVLECVNTSLTAGMVIKDGCCPVGATTLTDLDCLAVCGNGLLEAGEKCDTAITTGQGKCPIKIECDDKDVCTADSVLGANCAAKCDNKTLVADLTTQDSCCPKGASSITDVDCKVSCGNGLLEAGETCDPKITSGPGMCPTIADCDDKDVCTKDTLGGGACTLKCSNAKMAADLSAKDGCCPVGENALTDKDCLPTCGNGIREAGEECDTAIISGKGICPITSADCDDSDLCTTDKMAGSACSAKCDNSTMVAANATTKDGCCPTGETYLTDLDCTDPCANVNCPQGQKCKDGKCTPTDKDGGTVVTPDLTLDGASNDKGGDVSTGTGGGSDNGCDCQTSGETGSLPGLMLLGLMLVLVRRRKRG